MRFFNIKFLCYAGSRQGAESPRKLSNVTFNSCVLEITQSSLATSCTSSTAGGVGLLLLLTLLLDKDSLDKTRNTHFLKFVQFSIGLMTEVNLWPGWGGVYFAEKSSDIGAFLATA